MDPRVSLSVRLRVPDTTALSAEDILKRKMGFGERLERLSREDWWLFDLRAENAGAAEARVETWAGRCTALVNPNKHRAVVECVTSWPPREPGRAVRILVRDMEDVRAASMMQFLRKSFGAEDLLSLASGTLWTLDAGPGVSDPRALAAEIAVTRSRDRGLLANPHAQTVEIWQQGGR